jgi:hypothetical protein
MKSKFVEKLGDQYELLSGYETATEVKNILKESNLPLSKEQFMALYNAFGDSGMCGNLDMPFIAYKWKEKENQTKWQWRLTVPFFGIWWVIFVFVILPFKWLFTGNLNFKQNSKLINFNTHWYNKVVGRKWSK